LIVSILIKIGVVALSIGLSIFLFSASIGKRSFLLLALVCLWLGYFSSCLSDGLVQMTEPVVFTAVGAQNAASKGNQIFISGFTADGEKKNIYSSTGGTWAKIEKNKGGGDNKWYWVWFAAGDDRCPAGETNTLTIEIPVGKTRSVQFMGHAWGGIVSFELEGKKYTADTYSAESPTVTTEVDASSAALLAEQQMRRLPYFAVIYLFLATALLTVMRYVTQTDTYKKLEKRGFLFHVLVRRDFILKYKRTMLGMLWSLLSPLINLLIMWLVFNQILASNIDHFVIYMFAGQLVFSYFADATTQGMNSLLENAGIITKINVPKFMFLLSKNISSLINFFLTLLVFFIFVAADGLPFTGKYLLLVYPTVCLIVFNIGTGLILSALYVFFRDMQYLWGLLTQLIMWVSAIFYSIDNYPQVFQNIFLLNPIYLFIRYFRKIVIESTVPTLGFHLMIAGYTLLSLGIGCFMYKKYNHEFLYYI